MSRLLAPLVLVALLLAAWEIAVRALGVPAYFLPPPSGVAIALVQDLPALAAASWITLSTALIALAIASLTAVGLAVLVASLSLPLAAHHMLPDSPTGCRVYGVVEDAYEGTVTRFHVLAPGRIRTEGMGTAWSTGREGPTDPVVSLQWSLE